MDFSHIALTRQETKLLRLSRNHTIEYNSRLLRLRFIEELSTHVPGNKPVGTGEYVISNLGNDYLMYRRDLNRTRVIIPIAVSLITNLVLFLIRYYMPLLLSLLQQQK